MQLEKIKSNRKFVSLSMSNLTSVKGGQATEGGSEALQAEMLYNQNNEFVGWRTHYRSWGSDDHTGDTWRYYNVDYYYEDRYI